jgi:hypothetical protein
MAKLARKLRTALPSEHLHHDEGLHCNAFHLMFKTVTIAYGQSKLKNGPSANCSSGCSGIDEMGWAAGADCCTVCAREPQHIDLNEAKNPDIPQDVLLFLCDLTLRTSILKRVPLIAFARSLSLDVTIY